MRRKKRRYDVYGNSNEVGGTISDALKSVILGDIFLFLFPFHVIIDVIVFIIRIVSREGRCE